MQNEDKTCFATKPDLHSFRDATKVFYVEWNIGNYPIFSSGLNKKQNVNTYAALEEPYLLFDGVIEVMHLLRFTNIKSLCSHIYLFAVIPFCMLRIRYRIQNLYGRQRITLYYVTPVILNTP